MEIVNNYDIDGLHLDYVRWNEHSSGSFNTLPPGQVEEIRMMDGTIAQEVAAIDADYVRDYEIKDEVNADKDLLGSDNIAKTTTLTGKEHAMYISIIQYD